MNVDISVIGYTTMAHTVIASVHYPQPIESMLTMLAASPIAAMFEAIGKPTRGAFQRADAA